MAPAGIRREDELILCCARTSIDSKTGNRIRALLREEIDWKYLTELASFHRLSPLLYRSLNTTAPEAVPQAILNQLQRCFHANALTNSLLSKELVKLLSLFAAYGIPAVPYKGPALAVSIYGNGALRQSGDLDILIRRRDVPRARELLISARYRPLLTDAEEKTRLESHYHLDFARQDNNVLVELHWALTPKYWGIRLPLESMEQRLDAVPLAGKTVPSLPQQELLLILCAHGAKHLWGRLRWICDVAELLRTEVKFDWEQLLAQAKRIGCRRILFLGLFLAKDLLQAPIPPEIWQKVLTDPVVPLLAEQVHKELFISLKIVPEPANLPAFYLMARERFPDRIRYFCHDHLRGYLQALLTLKIRNTGENGVLSRPGALRFLSHLARPFRVVAVHGIRMQTLLLKYLLGR